MPRSEGRRGWSAGPVPFDLMPTASAMVDDSGMVVGWSSAAEQLTGYAASDVLGLPIARFVESIADLESVDRALASPGASSAVLRVHSQVGRTLTLGVQATPHVGAAGVRLWHLAAVDLSRAPWWDASHAVLGAFLTRSPYGIAVLDTELRYVWLNETLERMAGVPLSRRLGRRMSEVLPQLAPRGVEQQMRQVLETGVPVLGFEYQGYVPADPGREHAYSTSFLRLDDGAGRVLGICYMGVDITEKWRTRQRLTLLTDSGARIGTTLDLSVTAAELVEVAVPAFADFAAVDLLETVIDGAASTAGPGLPLASSALRRVAHHSAHGGVPEAAAEIGEPPEYPESSPMAQCLLEESAILVPELDADRADWLAEDPLRAERVKRWGMRSLMAVPLRARGTVLGIAVFVRAAFSDAFEDDDLALAEELASRAALCLDNARRYARERETALTLQRSLLPGEFGGSTSVDIAVRYLPAGAAGGVGGDWFDVIPLSGARVALVVGDPVGHGISAAAAMGRLRAAVHTLADMDLPPEELLAHLDDLVLRLVDEESSGLADHGPASNVQGARCLYAVYDPVTVSCTVARAGHVPPLVVTPGRTVLTPELPAGPPLGVGTFPFEAAEFDVEEGTVLVLFTDGLLRGSDPARSLETDRLAAALSSLNGDLERAADDLLAAMLDGSPVDDIALVLARTHALGRDHVATCDVPNEPEQVARARAFAMEQLSTWGLDDLAWTTELIVSELVTNAIRYGTPPVRLRLIRHAALICEVTDGSSTSPRLHHARTTDEGGRGLFMVAQVAHRWGTRYTAHGKIIWAEQPLDGR
ncbi:SpoIIE family protein phosphatase [Streptomyces sp. NBC_00887]|nr:SpoIIE family protein phosphatase [Streptomyces sp. NBC_00887]WSY36324.1 SpoIIE family protein phosphatase [Streptomyces sp. NBC_00887]